MMRETSPATPVRHLIFTALALALASPATAQDRVIPFWDDRVPAAIHAEVDGVAALETIRELGRFHRVQGSPGYAAAAEYMKKKAIAADLAGASIERFPADGKTTYAHFKSSVGWNPVAATFEEISPRPRVIARFPDLPVLLADYSQDADVTADLVDVGKGTDPRDFEAKDVRGRIVLADGALPAVHRRACEERGAVGFVSDFPNQHTPWSDEERDLIRWGHLSPYQPSNRFAIMISKRQADELRARLASGEKIRLHVFVRAKMVPDSYDVVVATIPGTDPRAGEVVLTAHLCHESAGANDNASGSAAILEVGRALQAAIAKGTLPKPHRTIRILWLPEITGSQAYLARHPEIVKRLAAGIHMDMVGGILATTHGTFHLSRTTETLPHVVNAIARAFFDQVVRASARYAERGDDSYAGFVWPPGSREAFLGDLRGFEMGSDHEVFQAGGFRVPMVYFHDYPDVTIHTQKDQPENMDATKLGRVAYMGAGIAWTLAALPREEAPRLLAYTRGWCQERVAEAEMAGGEGRDRELRLREAAAEGSETLASLDRLWPISIMPLPGAGADELAIARGGNEDRRIPVRSPNVVGPLDIYYYDFFTETLGADVSPSKLASRSGGEILAYETLNLVDGRRMVSEIRDILAGRYQPVPTGEIADYLDLLAKAKAITWK
jgi:aminopeptidase YwaD